MSENEKNRDDFEEERTKIFVPDRDFGNDEQTGPSADQSAIENKADPENVSEYENETQANDSGVGESTGVRTPEQASADYVRHVQEERRKQSDQDISSHQDSSSNQGTVFCMNCGTKNNAGSKFCIRCGQPLNQEPAAPQNYASQSSPQQNNNGPQPSYRQSNGPRPSSYQNNGPQPSYGQGNYTGYQQGGDYGNSYRQGAGPQPSQQQYSGGPQYQPYQNGPAPDYYRNGNGPQPYGYGNGYGGYSGNRAASPEKIMRIVFTALIGISLLFTLFGRIVNKSATMSLVTSGISSYLPSSLDDLEDYFDTTYAGASDLYSDLSATVRYLRKDGYSSIDLAGMDRTLAKTAGSLSDLMDIGSAFSDSEQDTVDALEDLQRSANIGFFVELILILATAAFSIFSIYTVWKSNSVSKRRGVLCILAGINLVFMIVHFIIVGIVNSAFKQIILDVMGSQSLSSAYSGLDLGKVFNASVGGLLLPLIFTIAAVAADVAVGHLNGNRR